MAVTITVRNVPDEVRNELAARAARSGRSMQEFLSLELARLAETPSAAEAVMRARLNARSYPELPIAVVTTAIEDGRR